MKLKKLLMILLLASGFFLLSSCVDDKEKTKDDDVITETESGLDDKTKVHTHTVATAWSYDDKNHWHACLYCNEPVKLELEAHKFILGIVTTPPQVGVPGVKTFKCECEYSYTEEIPALEHTHESDTLWLFDENKHWHDCNGCEEDVRLEMSNHLFGEGEVTLEPQIGVAGEKTFTCLCGYTYKEEIPALEHTHESDTLWLFDENKHWHSCNGCEENVKLEESDHIFKVEIINPQCEIAGIEIYTCECSYSYSVEIPALEHDLTIEWYYDHTDHFRYCTKCESTLKFDINPHSFDSGVITKEAEIGVAGEIVFTCECEYFYTEEIPALEHTHVIGSVWLYNAYKHWHNCPGCDEDIKFEEEDHKFDSKVVTVEPQIGVPGVMTYTCRCGYTYKEEIPALEHTHESDTSWLFDENKHWHSCNGCEEDVRLDESDHVFNVEKVKPQCEIAGIEIFTCDCGYSYRVEIPALEHDLTIEWYYNDTNHFRYCTICESTLKFDVNPHSFDSGVITKEAEIGVAGEIVFTCECEYFYTEEISALEPEHIHESDTSWLFDENKHWHSCNGCEEDVRLDESDHIFKVEKVKPQCEIAGIEIFTCDCGYSYSVEIPALEHDLTIEWYYNDTNHFRYCTICESTLKFDVNPHSFDSGVITKEAEIGVAGEIVFTCECEYFYKEEIPALEPEHIHETEEEWSYDKINHWHVCFGCDEDIDKAPHEFKEEITKEPEIGVAGVKTFTCECSYYYTEIIPQLEPEIIETTVADLVLNKPTGNLNQIYIVEAIWTNEGVANSANKYGNGTLIDEDGNKINVYGFAASRATCLTFANKIYTYKNPQNFVTLNLDDYIVVKVGMVYTKQYDNYSIYLIEQKGSVRDDLAVEIDINNLKFDDFTTGDLILPTLGRAGSKIVWESSNEEVISSTGKVVRPEIGEDDVRVTLTATVTKGDAYETFTFDITVKAKLEQDGESKVLATFTFGNNGTATHYDGSEISSSKTYNADGYTLKLEGVSKVYDGARDAKGNSALKLGTGSSTAKFSFTVGADVKSVVIYVAKYKSNAAKVTLNGITHTINTASDSGLYTAITIDTSITKTVSLTTVSGSARCMINTIEFYS